MNQSLRAFAVLLAGFAASCCLAAEPSRPQSQPPDPQPNGTHPTGAQPTIATKWQPVDLRFTYTPTTTYYSCDALEWKLERLFKSIGAHPKSQVDANGCASSGPSQYAFVHVMGAVPVPSNQAAPVDQKSASQQDLLKRLGVKSPFELVEFQSTRTEVDLARLDAAILEPGDCELLEQLGREVLPKFGTTVVRALPRCFPGRVPLSTPIIETRCAAARHPTPMLPRRQPKP